LSYSNTVTDTFINNQSEENDSKEFFNLLPLKLTPSKEINANKIKYKHDKINPLNFLKFKQLWISKIKLLKVFQVFFFNHAFLL